MNMQDLSYDFNSPVFEFNGLTCSIDVYSFENVYTLKTPLISVDSRINKMTVTSDSLTFAGGQQECSGEVVASFQKEKDKTFIEVLAKQDKVLRDVKLTLHHLPKGQIVNLRETSAKEIPEEGLVYTYPSGWRGLYTPLLVLKLEDESYMYFRSLDKKVREKRFALIPSQGGLKVELIFEESGHLVNQEIRVPKWEIGYSDSLEEILSEQNLFIKENYKFEDYENRKDVPDWMHDISLIAMIHMQHWTGFTFSDYQGVVDQVKWLAKEIDPKRILVYLPGWDGRFYWKYGIYNPEETLGGHDGMQFMMNELRALGVRTMLMFGMNVVNKGLENYEQWGNTSLVTNVNGCVLDGVSVDWDGSRHYRHGSNAMVNPGAPGWQRQLTNEISKINRKYKMDAVFLDISAWWSNEANFDCYEGTRDLIERIKDENPGILVVGEAWYDAMTTITPVVQCGHTDGIFHWHDEPYEPIFNTYCRQFAHLCLGDPSRGSTGVHELGYNSIQGSPYRESIIPTISIVDGTIENAGEEVMEIINQAKAYAKDFLERR